MMTTNVSVRVASERTFKDGMVNIGHVRYFAISDHVSILSFHYMFQIFHIFTTGMQSTFIAMTHFVSIVI